MLEDLPNDVRDGLSPPRSRYRVRAGGQTFVLLRHGADSFTLEADAAPRLRGLVDIYDGDQPHAQCLVVASRAETGETVYEIKRRTFAADAPARDYVPGGEDHEIWI